MAITQTVSSFAVCRLILLQFCLGAEFRNLGFDEAATTGLRRPDGRPQGLADPASVLPGWNLYLGGEPHSIVHVNPILLPPRGDYAVLGDGREFFGGPTEGKFAFRLVRSDPGAPVWKLEQAGTIPANTKFLTYRSERFGMQVEINEEIIPPLDWQLPGQPGLSNLVYDVSKFAGHEVKLSFVGPFGPYGWPGFEGQSHIDSIAFLAEEPKVTAVVQRMPGGKTNEVRILFTPIAGRQHVVEFRDDLTSGAGWQNLAGAPHNSGTATDVSPASHRFYRLKVYVLREPP